MSLYEHIKAYLFFLVCRCLLLFGASDLCCCLVQIITGNKKAHYVVSLYFVCVLFLAIVLKIMFVIEAVPIQCNDKKGH